MNLQRSGPLALAGVTITRRRPGSLSGRSSVVLLFSGIESSGVAVCVTVGFAGVAVDAAAGFASAPMAFAVADSGCPWFVDNAFALDAIPSSETAKSGTVLAAWTCFS